MRAAAAYETLVSTVWPSRVGARINRAVFLAIVGTVLLTVSAKIQVPFWPVPMTMQTMVVLLIGMAFGARLGAATVALYLLEGAFGLPVFAGTPEKGIGLAYIMGPTGGFLVGFVVAAAVVGWLAERGFGRSLITTLVAMIVGSSLIYLFGVSWLATLIGWDQALALGVTPFLAGAALKIVLATALLPTCWKFAGTKSR